MPKGKVKILTLTAMAIIVVSVVLYGWFYFRETGELKEAEIKRLPIAQQEIEKNITIDSNSHPVLLYRAIDKANLLETD